MACHITQVAADKLLTGTPHGQMLRIWATGGGSSGLVFHVDMVRGSYRGDHLLHIGAVTITVDQYSLPYLSGRTLDFRSAQGSNGFILR
jgi:Fe-S cluster assembly iron-binding protein IscA